MFGDINWTAISATATFLTVIVAVGGYIITWNMNKANMKQQNRFFQEEFRPVLVIQQTGHGGTFQITNIGNRAAKKITIELSVPSGEDIKTERDTILEQRYCLQPNSAVEYIWREHSKIKDNTKVDVSLRYNSLSGIEYLDSIQIIWHKIFDFE